MASSNITTPMSSLEKLPIELIGYVFLALDDPSDLLHVASTCKFFHKMIIETHHLHLTNISCDPESPPEFWQKLSVTPHYASMIRHLELCNRLAFKHSLSWRRQFRGRRIDRKFAGNLVSDSFSLVSVAFDLQEFFFKSLDYMDGLKFVSIRKEDKEESIKGYDCLRHISKNFSNSLEVLHIHHFRSFSRYIPLYKPLVRCFSCG